MAENEDKVIVEQNGQSSEVSREKLNEMQSNPDFQVEQKEDSDNEYKVKTRLMD